MEIILEGTDVYRFEADQEDLKWIGLSSNFNEAKQMYLKSIEEKIESEIQRIINEYQNKGVV
ncbi:hypothetical protein [Rossellomorea marisflavi]|uniref:hypothetical protein n=1 Tax=Rossellomorea marisflavi TaxID=189381 RepID=UPI00345CE1BB